MQMNIEYDKITALFDEALNVYYEGYCPAFDEDENIADFDEAEYLFNVFMEKYEGMNEEAWGYVYRYLSERESEVAHVDIPEIQEKIIPEYEQILTQDPCDETDSTTDSDTMVMYFSIKPEFVDNRIVRIRATCKKEIRTGNTGENKIPVHVINIDYSLGEDYIHLGETEFVLVEGIGSKALYSAIGGNTNFYVADNLDVIKGN